MEISTGGSVDVLSKNSLCGIRSRSAGGGVRGEHGLLRLQQLISDGEKGGGGQVWLRKGRWGRQGFSP